MSFFSDTKDCAILVFSFYFNLCLKIFDEITKTKRDIRTKYVEDEGPRFQSDYFKRESVCNIQFIRPDPYIHCKHFYKELPSH